MALLRNFNKNLQTLLQKESLFKNKLLPDLLKQEVFMTIRNDYVDFYYKGGRLFRYDKNGFQTHIKFAAVIPKQGKDYLTESQLMNFHLAGSFTKEYSRIKENCANYSGVEALGVSGIYHRHSYLANENVVVLDIEIAFQSLNSQNKTDRIDLLLFDKERRELMFVEAKHYSNPEIRSTTMPRVIQQIKRYESQINQNNNNILTAYNNYVNDLNSILNLSIPGPLLLHEQVKLLIFGFDKDQQKGSLNSKILPALGSAQISCYAAGDPKKISLQKFF
jgi:DNA polymerase sigma